MFSISFFQRPNSTTSYSIGPICLPLLLFLFGETVNATSVGYEIYLLLSILPRTLIIQINVLYIPQIGLIVNTNIDEPMDICRWAQNHTLGRTIHSTQRLYLYQRLKPLKE